MKTPYDTALRALGREIDVLRAAIGVAARRLDEAEAMHADLSEAIVRESALAAGDWRFASDGYRLRAYAERERLTAERRAAEARLDALRQEATERYGAIRAMESAAGSFRDEAERAIAAAEQGLNDDVVGARLARGMRLARLASRRAAQEMLR